MKQPNKLKSKYITKEVNNTIKETIPTLPISKRTLQIAKKKPVSNTGDIKQAEDYTWLDKAWDIASNPVTAFGYKARGEELPDNFGRDKEGKNAFDHVLDLRNPFFYANQVQEGSENVAKGEYSKAGLNALNMIPVGEELGMFHKLEAGLTSKGVNLFKDAEMGSVLASKYAPKIVKGLEKGYDIYHKEHMAKELFVNKDGHKEITPNFEKETAKKYIVDKVKNNYTGKPNKPKIIAQNMPDADFMTHHTSMNKEHGDLINNFIQ